MQKVLSVLREMKDSGTVLDMMVCNYVYEHTEDNTSFVINYRNVFPQNRVFEWEDIGSFRPYQFLLMHSVIYRTGILRECNLELPKHTFYVDNLFVYKPLPYVKTIYYLDVDLYRYFIGRSDQSVNEQVMLKRIDQQLRVNKLMIDAYDLTDNIPSKRLSRYMAKYLSMMMTISSVFLQISATSEDLEKKRELWRYLKNKNKAMYLRLRYRPLGTFTNLPGRAGRRLTVNLYRLTRKVFKYN
jgi:hypothetical protein